MVRNVQVSAAGVNVTVLWEHDGSGPPTQFNVERQVAGGGYTAAGSTPYVAGQTAYSVVDENGEHGVQYRVNASNAAGASAWVESNVPTLPPNAPTNVQAST